MAAPTAAPAATTESARRQKALEDYRKRLIDHRELDAKLKKSKRLAQGVALIKALLHPLLASAGRSERSDERVRQV